MNGRKVVSGHLSKESQKCGSFLAKDYVMDVLVKNTYKNEKTVDNFI